MGKHLHIRAADQSDLPGLVALELRVWGESAASEDMLRARLQNAPGCTLVAVGGDGTFWGNSSFCFLDYDAFARAGRTTWYDLTGSGTASTHDRKGRDLFGINLGVAAGAPQSTSRALLAEVARRGFRQGVRRLLLGSRMPGYHKYADRMTAEEYVAARRPNGAVLDPELRYYQSLGLRPVSVVRDYFRDPPSLDWGVVVEYASPFRHPLLRPVGKALAALPVDASRLVSLFSGGA